MTIQVEITPELIVENKKTDRIGLQKIEVKRNASVISITHFTNLLR
mgnify:FL=1